jgi:hypothetical protein
MKLGAQVKAKGPVCSSRPFLSKAHGSGQSVPNFVSPFKQARCGHRLGVLHQANRAEKCTARARTSGEKNLFVVLLVMAPTSQEFEPPTNPGRFMDAKALMSELSQ